MEDELLSCSSGDHCSYYDVLGIPKGSSVSEIRTAYRKLVLRWHPDRLSKDPSILVEEAKSRFQAIQEAYEVLSNKKKRSLYDLGFYDRDELEEEVDGFAGFMQEMTSLMSNSRKEKRSYSLNELQEMLNDVAKGAFEVPSWPPSSSVPSMRRSNKKRRRTHDHAFGGMKEDRTVDIDCSV